MAPAKTTLPVHQETDHSDCKFRAGNATTRNIVDLLLVITIIVLLSIAAPIIRGDHCDADKKVKPGCASQASCTSSENNKNSSCVCHVGFKGDGHVCTDIDECASVNSSCPTNAHCINSIGSYACECFYGYYGNQCSDVDECKLGIHTCDKHANCTNTVGSYKCTCHDGFYDDGFSCKDINECKAGSHICDQHTNCVNTNGSYTCV
ncbi:uncharacterized protein LOC144644156 isoform X2 [Oculina patagonica]